MSALDPWLSLFYMTTGRNLAGMLTNDGQQIHAWRRFACNKGAAWFSFDDHQVGSFVEGKYADLAVLSHDYLHSARADDSKDRVGADARRRQGGPRDWSVQCASRVIHMQIHDARRRADGS